MRGPNSEQRKAIEATEGPALIIAGPGTGKTYTLVERVIHLIKDKNVPSEKILIATFTNKAAKELVTRITNRLSDDTRINVNDMYVGTFHSICHRIIKEYPEFSRISKNYHVLEDFAQPYLVFRNLYKFYEIKDIKTVIGYLSGWNLALELCKIVDNLREEMVDINKLSDNSDPRLPVIKDILTVYLDLLEQENAVDFSGLQTECLRILNENPEILKELREKIQYIMVDEYQDTNYIQEQFIFLLGANHHNICVVGDDDQSLYRFRGATVRNILEFSNKFDPGECKSFKLEENYRSNKSIIDFYNKWMQSPIGFAWTDETNIYRLDKTIYPSEYNRTTKSPAAIRLSSENDDELWCRKICSFIKELKETGKIKNYNQIAFLFFSLKDASVIKLANYLEAAGINVYAPRSRMFFKRQEVLWVLGLLMIMFPKYTDNLNAGKYDDIFRSAKSGHQDAYYCLKNALKAARELLERPEHNDLKQFVEGYAEKHRDLTENTDYAYSGLLYKLFGFEPFSSILGTEMKDAGAVDLRPARNLAHLTKIIVSFEDTYKINVFRCEENNNGQKWIDYDNEQLFNTYLRLQINSGVDEYEDDSEYAPSGCVSFLTIHQSKGMEFPVVFVGSLKSSPFARRGISDNMLKLVEDKGYFNRAPFEPYDKTHFYDFWRLFYTAFSRAQDLLILTGNETSFFPPTPSNYFRPAYGALPSYDSQQFDIKEFEFNEVKDVELKETFSFTSHILVYEKCPRQYKFFKELEFAPVKENNVLFGMLVHQTIEDIHRAAIRKEVHLINPDQIEKWLHHNYHTLSDKENLYLGKGQIGAALKQVLQYAEAQKDNWGTIRQTEVDVSLVKDKYILEGKIDLIKGTGDTVEIVDFKSDGSPKADSERMEHYRRQLQLYAHLVTQRTGLTVSKMHLYYTAQKEEPMISFDYETGNVEETIENIRQTVEKIQSKDFSKGCANKEACKNCDFSSYCKR